MAHATMQYNVQLGTLRSEVMTSTTSLDKEHAFRDKLETEVGYGQVPSMFFSSCSGGLLGGEASTCRLWSLL